MTLEEMGRDYLRQAEELKPCLERRKAKKKQPVSQNELIRLNYEITVYEDIINDLIVQGNHLINYYHRGGNSDDEI